MEIVFQKLPLFFVFAAIVDRVNEIVVVIVVREPEHGLIRFLRGGPVARQIAANLRLIPAN